MNEIKEEESKRLRRIRCRNEKCMKYENKEGVEDKKEKESRETGRK